MRKLRATSTAPVVLGPVFPNAGVQVWYQVWLDALINEATTQLLIMVEGAWRKTPPLFNSHIISGDSALTLGAEAAGVIFRAPTGRLLLVRRTDGKGWAWPGGSIEPNETAEAAARREAFEETLFPTNGLLELVNVFKPPTSDGVRFATFVCDVLEEFEPTLNNEHDAFKWIEASALPPAEELHPGILKSVYSLYNVLAEDAKSPTKALQVALARWGSQSIKRFDLMANNIANEFTSRNMKATQASMLSQLQKAGFAIKFKPTMRSIEAYRSVMAENIALIKSIPRQWHEQVQQKVWNAVRNGSDLHQLSEDLRKTYQITSRRAALIARDQNAKAKATIERVRRHELGIRRAIWMHSHAGKDPRPTHVAMNNKPYNIAEGMWDSDEGEYIWPGELINCRCVDRAVIDGVEEDEGPTEPSMLDLQVALRNAERFANTPRAAEMREILERYRDARTAGHTADEKRLLKTINAFLDEG